MLPTPITSLAWWWVDLNKKWGPLLAITSCGWGADDSTPAAQMCHPLQWPTIALLGRRKGSERRPLSTCGFEQRKRRVPQPSSGSHNGCSTHEQPDALFCVRTNDAVADGTTFVSSRYIPGGRGSVCALAMIAIALQSALGLLGAVLPDDAWPSTHRPTRAGRCRCAGAGKPVSSLQTGSSAACLQPANHQRRPPTQP